LTELCVQALYQADYLNVNRLSALRFQILPASVSSYGFTATAGSKLILANATVSVLYSWNGSTFTLTGTLVTAAVNDWTHFAISGQDYLVNAADSGSSQIWVPNGASYTTSSTIGVAAQTNDWEFFSTGTYHYLAQATADSFANTIYGYNGASWVSQYTTPATTAQNDWEMFQIGSTVYAAAAFNGGNVQLYYSVAGNQKKKKYRSKKKNMRKRDQQRLTKYILFD
jgi:hypothetical protein